MESEGYQIGMFFLIERFSLAIVCFHCVLKCFISYYSLIGVSNSTSISNFLLHTVERNPRQERRCKHLPPPQECEGARESERRLCSGPSAWRQWTKCDFRHTPSKHVRMPFLHTRAVDSCRNQI